MPNPTQCPQCESADITYSASRSEWVCLACMHSWKTEDREPGEQDPPRKKRSVFISYGREDALDFAKRLAKDLEANGHRLFLDLTGIKEGRRWDVEVENGIRDAETVTARQPKKATPPQW